MIINKSGAEFFHNGKTYVIGEPIYTADESDYRGLFGTIIEIRDGDDKETDNDTPDIYCALDEPVLPYDRKELEKRFSALYGEKKGIEDIILDFVILSPEMIVQVNSLTKNSPNIDVFTITEECCSGGDTEIYTYFFTDYVLAKMKFHELIEADYENGLASGWKDSDEFITESEENSFSCWLDHEFSENHYSIKIEEEKLLIDSLMFKELGNAYIKESLKRYFYEQTSQWDEASALSDEEYNNLCASDDTAQKLLSELKSDTWLLEQFWKSLSETSHRIISEYLKKKEG